MSLEALWSVWFKAPGTSGYGGGVIVLETGRIFGGDSSYYYTGTYSYNGDKFNGTVSVKKHNSLLSPIIPGLKTRC